MIENLATHGAAFVTVQELAEYWDISRRQVYKHIEAGTLRALRLGARCYRIHTKAALEFERQMSSGPAPASVRRGPWPPAVPVSIDHARRR
jgi:excisionase family DNA binding protein